MVRKVTYMDEEIRDLHGKRFYLRSKIDRSKNKVIMSVRTQKGGKGLCLVRTSYIWDDRDTAGRAIKRLCKRWRRFYRVLLHPAWTGL